jgi:hypothetical protein
MTRMNLFFYQDLDDKKYILLSPGLLDWVFRILLVFCPGEVELEQLGRQCNVGLILSRARIRGYAL